MSGTVFRSATVLEVLEPTCRALHCRGVAVKAVSQPICRHCAAGMQLFKRCQNLPASTVMQRCRLFKQCWNLPAGHCVAGVQAV